MVLVLAAMDSGSVHEGAGSEECSCCLHSSQSRSRCSPCGWAPRICAGDLVKTMPESHQGQLLACWFCSLTKLCLILFWQHGLLHIRLLCQWDFPGKNTAVGFCFLLLGPGIEPGSPSWQADSSPLSHLTSHNCQHTQRCLGIESSANSNSMVLSSFTLVHSNQYAIEAHLGVTSLGPDTQCLFYS